MNTIVSTKILTKEQKQLVNQFDLIEYNAISVVENDFISSPIIDNAIITSQNAARIIIDRKLKVNQVFCVGQKTKQLLVNNGFNVVESCKNALDLSKCIIENYQQNNFVFFCGDKRRNELPTQLNKARVELQEIIVYKTILNPKKIDEKVNGVLFFSPSGVESYVLENNLKNTTAFCIGKTTAQEAKKYTDSIVIAKETTIESVLESVLMSF